MKPADIRIGDRLYLKRDNPYGMDAATPLTVAGFHTRPGYRTPWVQVAGVGTFKPSDFARRAS